MFTICNSLPTHHSCCYVSPIIITYWTVEAFTINGKDIPRSNTIASNKHNRTVLRITFASLLARARTVGPPMVW